MRNVGVHWMTSIQQYAAVFNNIATEWKEMLHLIV